MDKKSIFKAFISYYHTPDFVIAESLQNNLRKLGAKWFQLKFRALNIFRDKTDSSGFEGLKEKIKKGIDQSEFLILVASKTGKENCKTNKKKDWVYHEVEYWIQSKHPVEMKEGLKIKELKIIICITDGKIKWDEDSQDFDWTVTDCLPPILKNKFADIPAWVDFCGLREKVQENPRALSLEFPDFKQKIAETSSQLQGISIDQLIAKDRYFKFIGRVIIGVIAVLLTTLTILSVSSSVKAAKNEERANEQRDSAQLSLRNYEYERLKEAIVNCKTYIEANALLRANQELEVAKGLIKRNLPDERFSTKEEELKVLSRVIGK